MKACVIFNPAARGEKARKAVARLRSLSNEAVLRPTAAAGMGRPLAAEAAHEGFETVIAVGGDGTINEVVNGLADVPEGMTRCRLGIIPLGTANVFARELGLPLQVERAWEIIRRGQDRAVDVLEIDYQLGPARDRRLFVQLAGAGFDARATEVVDWELKKKIGFLAYVFACLRALREPHASINLAGGEQVANGELVLLGNGEKYGGPFRLFPGADLADGLMDVCVFPRIGYGLLLACCWAGATNGWGRMKGVHRFRSRTLELRSPGRVPVEIDGDPVGVLPASFRVLPAALRVLVPG